MLTTLLVILTCIVVPTAVFTFALCKSAALADRKLESLRLGLPAEYSPRSNQSEMDIPTTPVRSKLQPS
jgi:hypothetical protein